MRQIRKSVFETNSSSTHSISFTEKASISDLYEFLDIRKENDAIQNCKNIYFLSIDQMRNSYIQYPRKKLQLLYTDIFKTRPWNNDNSLDMWNELIELIETKHNIKITFHNTIDPSTNTEDISEWDKERNDWSDGNADNLIQLNHTKLNSDDNDFETRFKKLVIGELESVIEEKQEMIDKFENGIYFLDKTNYRWELYEDLEILKVKLNHAKHGNKHNWFLNCCEALPFYTVEEMYNFIIDDRFVIILDRD